MSIGKFIDAVLEPVIYSLRTLIIRVRIRNADRNAQVEARLSVQARANELHYQQVSLSLRTQLNDIERHQSTLPTKIKNWLHTGSID
jgi:hypothetical protein